MLTIENQLKSKEMNIFSTICPVNISRNSLISVYFFRISYFLKINYFQIRLECRNETISSEFNINLFIVSALNYA